MNHYRSVQSRFAGSLSRGAFVVSALICLSMFVTPVFAQYIRTDLVSNQAGVAPLQDEHLGACPRNSHLTLDEEGQE